MIDQFGVNSTDKAAEMGSERLRSGYTGQGPFVDKLEEMYQQKSGSKTKPLAMNSCTSAIDLSLDLVGCEPGDTVISTAQTCWATNCCPLNRRLELSWADVDPLTGLIDPKSVAEIVNSSVKAIIAVDWAGRSCDYDQLRAFGIPVIQDAAHCHNTLYKGERIDTRGGDYVCYSLQSIKHWTAAGDGGILIVPEEKYEEALLKRWFSLDRRGSFSMRCLQDPKWSGYKYNLNDVGAAVALGNIEAADLSVEKARANAKCFDEAFKDLTSITPPPPDPGCSYWLYSLLVEKGTKEEFMKHLADREIASSPVHHRNDLYTATAKFRRDLPGLDNFSRKQVSIPVGFWLTEEDRDRIISAVLEYEKL